MHLPSVCASVRTSAARSPPCFRSTPDAAAAAPHRGENGATRYQDLGPDYYERQRDHYREVSQLVGKLGTFGYEVALCRIPGTQAA